MAQYLNKAMLIGNLTRDPETRTTPNGQTVSTFGLATNRQWTDPSGVRQEKTEFHNIVVWGKLAEICAQFLAKGRKAYVEGRLQTRDWTGDDGIKRYRTEIVAENVIFLDRPPAAPGSLGDTAPLPPATTAATPSVPLAETAVASAEPAGEELKVENIPF